MSTQTCKLFGNVSVYGDMTVSSSDKQSSKLSKELMKKQQFHLIHRGNKRSVGRRKERMLLFSAMLLFIVKDISVVSGTIGILQNENQNLTSNN